MPPPSLNLTLRRLEKPDSKFVDDAVEIWVSLMREDPLAIALTGNDLSLITDLCRVITSGLVLTPGLGEAFAATDQDGVLVGFLVFTLPGQLLFSSEDSRVYGFYDYLEGLSPAAQEFFLKVMPKLPPEQNPAYELERESYWCYFAFVRSEYQRKGIATALFQQSFERAAELGVKKIALLAVNPSNPPIYRKMGFELLDHKKAQSPWNEYDLFYLIKETSSPAQASRVRA